jgi:uncharacterized protein (TIGR00251 family)
VFRLTVVVAPNASRNEIVGRHGDGWKARVAVPPERGRANAALVELISAALGIPRERVSVVAGHTARRKIVAVEGLQGNEVERRLEDAAGS